MANLLYINGMGASAEHDVEVHAAGCRDAVKKISSMIYDDAGEVPAMSIADLWEEYNMDFIAEGGAWPIAVYPCTGLVKKVSVYSGM